MNKWKEGRKRGKEGESQGEREGESGQYLLGRLAENRALRQLAFAGRRAEGNTSQSAGQQSSGGLWVGSEAGEAPQLTPVTEKGYREEINLISKASFATSQFYLSSAQLRRKITIT